ncbi:MAG: hypothetical protein E7047_03085 [Lentisphaerae bacterium]|nr:hypothetical protein [Lentisphaerota bacterium]
MKKIPSLTAALLAAASLSAAPAPEYKYIPFDVDPPVVIDGKISDWSSISTLDAFPGRETLGWDRGSKAYRYSGPEDLSGTVKMTWRQHGLFVMAQVTDNVHIQQGGSKTWGGDHLEVRLDMTPNADKTRKEFGEGQFMIQLSPGDFKSVKPEIRVLYPQGMTLPGGQIAVEKTDAGYNLEAFIPWAELDQKNVTFNRTFKLEVLLSDTDFVQENQQKFMMLGPKPYTKYRDRMVPAVLADGSGNAQVTQPEKVISSQEKLVKRDHPSQIEFTLSKQELDQYDYLLTFQARADFATPGGYAMTMLNCDVNNTTLRTEHLFNSDGVFTAKYGKTLPIMDASGALTLPWSPDYEAIDKHKQYAPLGRKSAEFTFALAGLLKPGKNVIKFKVIPNRRNSNVDMYVGKVALQMYPKGTLVDTTRPPQGKLNIYEPETLPDAPLYSALTSRDNTVRFQLGNAAVTLRSEFLTANGKWGSLQGTPIGHTRTVEAGESYILVRDKFVNRSNAMAAILQRHTLETSDGFKKIYIGGNEFPTRFNAECNTDSNPTIIGVSDQYSVGMLPWCDALSVHCTGAVFNGKAQMADYQFALGANAEYTVEFIIVPWNKGDYFSWINQARRILDVNMPITLLPGLWIGDAATRYSDSRQKLMIDNTGLNAVIQSNNCQRNEQNVGLRGNDWINSSLHQYHVMRKILDKFYPDKSVKQLIYFHCFLDTTQADIKKYNKDLIRLADGRTTTYGNSGGSEYLHGILPNEDGWAEVGEAWIDCIFDKVNADGIFWDEFVRSNIEYAYNEDLWDGVSADVNRNNGVIVRKKSSVTLLSLAWRMKMVEKIRARGKALIINGAPTTHTLRTQKIQTLFETGQLSSLNKGHLACPVSLGDHLTEKSFTEAWRGILSALDFGSLYCYYYTNKTHPTKHEAITKWMYPFTPVELHKGYLIGEERIITKLSGLFGWGDNSDFEALVFDRNGVLTDKYPVKKVVINGKTYAEVRIPGSCAAVIIRK